MSDDRLACYYYPTTVVFLDDKKDYLDSILLELDAKIKTKLFTHPKDLIKFLQAYDKPDDFLKRILTSCEDAENIDKTDITNVEHSLIDLDIYGIHKKVYDTNRFNEMIVIVIDYAMPTMNGLEVCKALEGKSFKYIMLTGQATPEEAIEGFNQGLIHRFVRKEAHDFINQLQAAIYELQKQHFQELSAPIIQALEMSRGSCVGDLVFVEFFNNCCQMNSIVEYYLINETGCFLMLDIDAKPSWLAVKNENDMKYYQDIAVDNMAPQNIINEIKNRQQVLFLLTKEDDTNVPVEEWFSYMYPATKLEGQNNNYYYAYITDSTIYNNNLNNIVSYKNFLLKR